MGLQGLGHACRGGNGSQLPGQDSSSLGSPQGLPPPPRELFCPIAIPIIFWNKALLPQDWQRDGAGIAADMGGQLWVVRLHAAPWGAVTEGGLQVPRREGTGCASLWWWWWWWPTGLQRASALGPAGCRLTVPGGRGSKAVLSPEPYRSQKPSRWQHRAAWSCDLAPSAKGTGGRQRAAGWTPQWPSQALPLRVGSGPWHHGYGQVVRGWTWW